MTLKVKQSDSNKFYTTLDKIRKSFLGKAPGKAYQMLAQYKVPIITLNVDMLHRIANSPYVCELHGNVYENNFVAYGEKANDWDKAADLINSGQPHDILLVIGMSTKSPLIKDMIITAISHNMHVIEIRKSIEKELEKVLTEKR